MTGFVRAIAIAAVVAVVLYAALLTVIYFGRNKLLFPGAGQAVQAVGPATTFPGAEELKIPVDGATFAHAWWIPSQSGTTQTLLCFHGNGYALEDQLREEAPALYLNRANLLLVDYRGYGTSSPIATTAETTAADARTAFRYLTEQRHIAPSDVWIFGRSIGAAVAVRLATETPNAGGLILLTPTTNTADVEPYRKLVRPMVWLGLTKEFDSLARMPRIHIPVTIIAGSLDTIAPPWMARQLFRAANSPKTIRIIDGAGHNDILAADKDHLIVFEIEESLLPETPAKPGPTDSSTKSPPSSAELAIQKYFALIREGALLSPEGWQTAAALFTTAKPYPAKGDILLTAAYTGIGEYARKGNFAAVGTKFDDDYGTLDGQITLQPADPVNLGSILLTENFKLEFTNRHIELDNAGNVLSETTGPWVWKILGPLSKRRSTPERAIAYVTHIRDTAEDPKLRKAAEIAILQMKKLHWSVS